MIKKLIFRIIEKHLKENIIMSNMFNAIFLGGSLRLFLIDINEPFEIQSSKYFKSNFNEITSEYMESILEYNKNIDKVIEKIKEFKSRFDDIDDLSINQRKISLHKTFTYNCEMLLYKYNYHTHEMKSFIDYDDLKDNEILIASPSCFEGEFGYDFEIHLIVYLASMTNEKITINNLCSENLRELLNAFSKYLTMEQVENLLSPDLASLMLALSELCHGYYGSVFEKHPYISLIMALALISNNTITGQNVYPNKSDRINKFPETINFASYDYQYYRRLIPEKRQIFDTIIRFENAGRVGNQEIEKFSLLKKFEPFIRLEPIRTYFDQWLMKFDCQFAIECIEYLLHNFETGLKNTIQIGNILFMYYPPTKNFDVDINDNDDRLCRMILRSLIRNLRTLSLISIDANYSDIQHFQTYLAKRILFSCNYSIEELERMKHFDLILDHSGFNRINDKFPYFLEKINIFHFFKDNLFNTENLITQYKSDSLNYKCEIINVFDRLIKQKLLTTKYLNLNSDFFLNDIVMNRLDGSLKLLIDNGYISQNPNNVDEYQLYLKFLNHESLDKSFKKMITNINSCNEIIKENEKIL